MHQLSPNTIIKGKKFSYTIKKILGQGTFGITYLATVKLSGDLGDLDGNIQVCLKEFFMKELNGRIGNTVTSSNNGGLVSEYNKETRIPSPIQISIIASILRPNVPNTPILSVDQLQN